MHDEFFGILICHVRSISSNKSFDVFWSACVAYYIIFSWFVYVVKQMVAPDEDEVDLFHNA